MQLHLLVACLAVTSLGAQSYSLLWQLEGTTSHEQFGETVALMRDIDGDGLAEVAVGSPAYPYTATHEGAVAVFSGGGGGLLWRTVGGTGTASGTSLVNIGDADGDGFDDLIAGAPYDLIGGQGAVHLLSGLTGQVLWTRTGGSVVPPGVPILLFGLMVDAVGDINGDGCGDVWVAGGDLLGSFGTVLSGRDGGTLRIHNAYNSRRYPLRACAIGDRDGDGYDDYAFGSPEDFTSGYPVSTYFGSITLVSGFTGQPFLIVEGEHVLGGTAQQPAFGMCLSAFGDMNADGFTDIVVGDPYWGAGTNNKIGRAQIVSGADGQILATLGGSPQDNRDYGRAVTALGDVSGDGYGDFVVQGRVRVWPYLEWVAQVVDGRTCQVLQSLWNDDAINLQWSNLAGGQDLNGDRIPDLVNGNPYSTPVWGVPPNQNGLVFAVDLGFSGVRPLARTLGVGCETSAGTLPQLRIEGLPKLGSSVAIVGRALPVQAPALLLLGPAQVLDLGVIGAPTCTGYLDPGFWQPGVTNVGGYLRQSFAVPPVPALQGLSLMAQWLALDVSANALGMVFSNAGEFELQP